MLRLTASATITLSSIAGCTDNQDANATLADLPALTASLQIWAGDDLHSTTEGFVSLSYDEEAFVAANGECATVGGLGVTFSGATVTAISRGGGGDLGCYFPQFAFELADFQDATSATLAFTVADAALTVDAVYAGLEPRRATLRNTNEWRFSASQLVTLGWSHPQDLVDGAQFTPMIFATPDTRAFEIPATFAGDEITLVFPDPVEFTGAGSLVTRFGYQNGSATTCTGAASCDFSLEAGYAHSAVVE